MIDEGRYKERILEHICGGYNLKNLQENFLGELSMERFKEIKPALPFPRWYNEEEDGVPYMFTIDEYREVISKHLSCVLEGENRLKVSLRWEPVSFCLDFKYDYIEVRITIDGNNSSQWTTLSRNIDPNEVLYALSDIGLSWGSWERQWQRLMDENQEDGRYLESVRERILPVMEKEMRGLGCKYVVEAGANTSKIQLHTPGGQHLVIEVDNYRLEENLEHIGYLIVQIWKGISAMNKEPKITLGETYIEGVTIESKQYLPQESLEMAVSYQNADVLLMDPAYSRLIQTDEDTELECSDLVVDTLVDGTYYVFEGCLDDYRGHTDSLSLENAIGKFTLDTGRIGVYDYSKAIKECPQIEEDIEAGKINAAIIRDFSGNVSYLKDEDDDVHVVGVSEDGKKNFFTMECI